ncbi:hypothetical protein FACS1894105_01550 [Clostridia bacterium]|nr:hypothetical protein FACS1894105_01440 [Clostridia bacterium]GHU34557.1 hypothetical protein FACS1894105_01550 [Clostridia bacterium]
MIASINAVSHGLNSLQYITFNFGCQAIYSTISREPYLKISRKETKFCKSKRLSL